MAIPSDRTLALTQGTWWFASGVWPILHLRSFEAVTGPKLEGWLVKTVGSLIAVIGAGLLYAGLRRREVSPDMKLVAAGAAVVLGTVDVIYPLKKRISPVYLADAAPELALALGWVLSTRHPIEQPSD